MSVTSVWLLNSLFAEETGSIRGLLGEFFDWRRHKHRYPGNLVILHLITDCSSHSSVQQSSYLKIGLFKFFLHSGLNINTAKWISLKVVFSVQKQNFSPFHLFWAPFYLFWAILCLLGPYSTLFDSQAPFLAFFSGEIFPGSNFRIFLKAKLF